MNSYKKIFSPISIKNISFSNRLVVSAMVTNYANEDGSITDRFRSYYETKAKGGWGLIIVEDFPVNPTAGKFKNLPRLFTDQQAAQYQDFTNTIHKYNTKVFAQIYHAGSKASSSVTGAVPVAPSRIAVPGKKEIPHVLTEEEIHSIAEDFASCALKVKNAGFDGVEIHGGHGYLINQFTSKATNKRTDQYGGSLENRMRFAVEVVEKVRETVGPDFIICYRLTSVEFCEDGTTLEESSAMAGILENAGVDILNITQGSDQSYAVIPPCSVPPAVYANHARQIKKTVTIPVMTVGRINTPHIAESLLASDTADFIVMARASIADPYMPQKLLQNRTDEIQYCIGCLQGCAGQNRIGKSVRCMVNPITGRESEYDLTAAPVSKKVVIIGGGVSGCSAAIAASIKGHHVVLFEQSDHLGGQWIAASAAPGKHDYFSFLNWQHQTLIRYGAEIRLNTSVTLEKLEQEKADAIILATGSRPVIPPIPGIDCANVIPAVKLLQQELPEGNTAVVIGGGLAGAETALYLASKARNVSIVEMQPKIVADGEPNANYYLLKDLEKYHVNIYTSARICKFDTEGVHIEQNGEAKCLPAPDYIVAAAGVRSNCTLREELEPLHCPIFLTGDAKNTKNGFYNIQESFELGLSI